MQVLLRLRSNTFEMEGALLAPAVPYLPLPVDRSDSPRYESRDSKSRGRGYSSSSRYDSNEYPLNDGYGSYGGSQVIWM